ncbi:putative heat shock protein family 70 protein [Triangularia setosa]|uniref:Heat shock protein family 70 protein n=1 Tax=Triangularia setosa TaxID=2587417 RepID=A0AAN7AAT8_9PEZI|nr:putative heat shock protein family 70 protein [Podospora setosa]
MMREIAAAQNLKPTIIVGIDLGTIFTSIAWASTDKPGLVKVLRDWPSPEGRDDDSRVPTKLFTGGKWGFNIPDDVPGDEVMQWFKLGLYPWAALASSACLETLRRNTSPEKLTKDYLTGLLAHARQQMDFASLPEDYEYIITVPAVWSNESKEKSKTAFDSAIQVSGMPKGTIHLLSEPEAAVIHVLSEKSESSSRSRDRIELGDTFVVCDADGGTVDLITYTVINVNPLEVKEAVPGDGDVVESSASVCKGIVKQTMAEFEATTKRCFSKDSGARELSVQLPDNDEAGIKKTRFKFESKDLEGLFKPAISAIIEQRLLRPPYLYDELRAAVHRNITFIHPDEPEFTITYGAIKKGLSLADAHGLTKVRGARASTRSAQWTGSIRGAMTWMRASRFCSRSIAKSSWRRVVSAT